VYLYHGLFLAAGVVPSLVKLQCRFGFEIRNSEITTDGDARIDDDKENEAKEKEWPRNYYFGRSQVPFSCGPVRITQALQGGSSTGDGLESFFVERLSSAELACPLSTFQTVNVFD